MGVLGLAVQLYGRYPEDGANALLSLIGDLTKQLDVQVTLRPVSADGWVDLDISGEDAEAAQALIAREVGSRPRSLGDLVVSQVLRGKITSHDWKEGVRVDVGIRQPQPIDLLVPSAVLRSQMPYGDRASDAQLGQLWCLREHFPLELRLSWLEDGERPPEAELSEGQIDIFNDWVDTALDRVVALGATLRRVRSALRSSRHLTDAARLDRLGLLEVSLLCKLGTDAPGIIHDIGRLLPGVPLHSFQPSRVVKPARPG